MPEMLVSSPAKADKGKSFLMGTTALVVVGLAMTSLPIRAVHGDDTPLPHEAGENRPQAPALAQADAAKSATEGEEQAPLDLPAITVPGFRGVQVDDIRYTRPLQDTPRIITILPDDLLQEQNATSLKDAMRNIPGISLQAGEGNPPGGDQLKIRGFNARDDININGARDLGNYFRDPFFVEQLEIVKGPNSAFAGRGSAGGTINFVTKKPHQEQASRVEAGLGTDQYRRVTFDTNQPIDSNSAARFNVMGFGSDMPGRDVAKEERFGVYGAYKWGFQRDTRITADVLHVRQSDLPDAGLPFDRAPTDAHSRGTGRLPPGLDFSNFYGHQDDYRKVDVYQVGLAVEHQFDRSVLLKNQTRYSHVQNDSIVSSPRIRNIPATSSGFDGAQVRGDLKPRDQKDEGFFNQTDVLFSFGTAGFAHDLVIGLEVGQVEYTNKRRPDVNGPLTDLYNPQPRVRPAAPYDGTTYAFRTREAGIYALDTISITPQWELSGGLRWDIVEATAKESGRPGGDNRHLQRTDTNLSYSLGLVHKLTPDISLYGSFGTAFEISGDFDRNQIQLAGGGGARVADPDTFNLSPEKTTAYEAGVKWSVGANLDVNAAVFRTNKSNARFPGQAGGDNTVLDNEVRVQGVELLAAGDVTDRWRLYAGYAFLDSKVLSSPSRPYAEGQELGGTPQHSFSLFSTYDVTPEISVGGGVQYVGQQYSSVQATPDGTLKVSVPSYTVADLYAAYRFTPETQLRLNVNNVFDKRYIAQVAEGGAQGIPGPGRQIVLTLRHDF